MRWVALNLIILLLSANNASGADADAIDYLLSYADFPRSVSYCLNRVAASAKGLPDSPAILQHVHQLQHLLKQTALNRFKYPTIA
ncbi:alpha-E domain-containing protein [Alishewanella longhuensis]